MKPALKVEKQIITRLAGFFIKSRPLILEASHPLDHPEEGVQRYNRSIQLVSRRYALDLNVILIRWKISLLRVYRKSRACASDFEARAVFL